ncbi:hypothetical protein WG66_015100 [Moniliophthora roreri]|nr:hypothetical protein WG66_015100 [Moniliophthora roreri]
MECPKIKETTAVIATARTALPAVARPALAAKLIAQQPSKTRCACMISKCTILCRTTKHWVMYYVNI